MLAFTQWLAVREAKNPGTEPGYIPLTYDDADEIYELLTQAQGLDEARVARILKTLKKGYDQQMSLSRSLGLQMPEKARSPDLQGVLNWGKPSI